MPAGNEQDSESEWDDARLRAFLSGEPLFPVDQDLRILAWYRAAEELTGVSATEAVGRRCFEVLAGAGKDGLPICCPDCPHARLVRESGRAGHLELSIRTVTGPRRVELSTIQLAGAGPPVLLHLLRRSSSLPVVAETPDGPVALTARQREILQLLVEGVRVKGIALHLGLTQTTVRNHIRGLLARLGCHSQLEAVAKARRLGIVERGGVTRRRGKAVSRRGQEAGGPRPPVP